MTSYSIAGMRAIEPFYAAKLRAARIRSSRRLLERATTPRDRKRLAEETGIPQENILKWANMADLMRVPGIAADHAELLSASGVYTVRELKRRNIANLAARLAQVNEEKKIVRLLPSEKRIARWMDAAQSLEAMIHY